MTPLTYRTGTAAKVMELPVAPQTMRLLIRLAAPREKTAGGIVKPDSAVQRDMLSSLSGEVVAMGPLCFTDPFYQGKRSCEIGDQVLFTFHAGHRFRWRGDEYRILCDQDILGVTEVAEELEP